VMARTQWPQDMLGISNWSMDWLSAAAGRKGHSLHQADGAGAAVVFQSGWAYRRPRWVSNAAPATLPS
jgi:hypothetical protein